MTKPIDKIFLLLTKYAFLVVKAVAIILITLFISEMALKRYHEAYPVSIFKDAGCVGGGCPMVTSTTLKEIRADLPMWNTRWKGFLGFTVWSPSGIPLWMACFPIKIIS